MISHYKGSSHFFVRTINFPPHQTPQFNSSCGRGSIPGRIMPDSNINGSRQIANYFRYIFRSEAGDTSGEKATPTSSFNLFVSNIKFIFFPSTSLSTDHSSDDAFVCRNWRTPEWPTVARVHLVAECHPQRVLILPTSCLLPLSRECVCDGQIYNMMKSKDTTSSQPFPGPLIWSSRAFSRVFPRNAYVLSLMCTYSTYTFLYLGYPTSSGQLFSCPPRANTGKQPSARGPSPRPDIFCDILFPAHESLPGPTYR